MWFDQPITDGLGELPLTLALSPQAGRGDTAAILKIGRGRQ